MLTLLRVALVVVGLAVSVQLSASTEFTLVRGGVGLIGAPQQLSGILDSNGNGRPELLVAGRWHVSVVEEDASARGYRELARLDSPDGSQFEGAMLVDIPGAEQALLLRWSDQLQLRATANMDIKAVLPRTFATALGDTALGDVDGDGLPEIVMANSRIELLDPTTLASRGSLQLSVNGVSNIAVADIVGDSRAEIITDDGRAYTITRSGDALSSTEVWNAGFQGTWYPHVVDFEGNAAIVWIDLFHYIANLTTFLPTPSLRTLISEGPSFSPVFADVNGDGRIDLIAASSSELRAIDMATGVTLWDVTPNPRSVNSPVAIDLDSDGTIEMAWADDDKGVVAVSLPLTGAPRWRSDFKQARVADWTMIRRAGGTSSIAYLTFPVRETRLGTLGFVGGSAFADQGGSMLAWLPGYGGLPRRIEQHAITSMPMADHSDVVVVSGAEYPQSGGDPLARFLWTFDGYGTLLSERALMTSIDPQRITAAQVLNRPERQLVIAGLMPWPDSGPIVYSARVEIVDYATGHVLWQSVPFIGAPVARLEVVDLDADGQLEIVFAYGENIAILKPSAGSDAIAGYVAQQYSVLDRGVGNNVKFSTLRGMDVAVYDGLSPTPEKTLVLPEVAHSIALFSQPPDDILMIATGNYGGVTLRRFADGEIIAHRASFPGGSLSAIDLEGDQSIEIVGDDLAIGRLEVDQVFRDGFDGHIP